MISVTSIIHNEYAEVVVHVAVPAIPTMRNFRLSSAHDADGEQ